jgi:hypothetical protein
MATFTINIEKIGNRIWLYSLDTEGNMDNIPEQVLNEIKTGAQRACNYLNGIRIREDIANRQQANRQIMQLDVVKNHPIIKKMSGRITKCIELNRELRFGQILYNALCPSEFIQVKHDLFQPGEDAFAEESVITLKRLKDEALQTKG